MQTSCIMTSVAIACAVGSAFLSPETIEVDSGTLSGVTE